MFTGIVEGMGTIVEAREGEGVRRLRIEVPPPILEGVEPGASVAVDGACLTPTEVSEDGFLVEVIGTTLSRTLAGRYREGSRVNLERAMILGHRMDGHLVQGHVDAVGHVKQIIDEGEYRLLRVSVPEEVHRHTLIHGSITLNGVSLTVNGLGEDGIVEVALISHTREATNLGALEPDDPVNVEGDLIGKYVGKLLGDRGQ